MRKSCPKEPCSCGAALELELEEAIDTEIL